MLPAGGACPGTALRLLVLLAAIAWASIVRAQPPGSTPAQQTDGTLMIVALSPGGFILVVGLMRWYGRRQAQARREQEDRPETVWERVDRHLAEADAEDDNGT